MKDRAFSVWSAAVDLVALGVLTLILCIPVVTICPAVTALYYSVAKSVRRGRGGPYKEYFRSFKENILQGIALSVILALFCAVGFFAAVYVVNRPQSGTVDFFYRATFFFSALVVFVVLAFGCPVLSRFRELGLARAVIADENYDLFHNLPPLLPASRGLAGFKGACGRLSR